MSESLEVRRVHVSYAGRGRARVPAVRDVSFQLGTGEILGLVGESGSGKTTIGRAILGLVPLAGGSIEWRGRRIDNLPRRAFRALRKELQLVFQDPAACLDPRMTVGASVEEPIRALLPRLDPAARAARAVALLAEVGLETSLARRYPHQLSGGQLQRAVIARALVVDPRLVVCDEPVSALDVSVQGQIVNLIARIRRDRGLACLFISHNLAVVARLASRALVMHRGRIVETATCRDLVGSPLHPYTRLLLDSVPDADPARARRAVARRIGAAVPLLDPAGNGCTFVGRCPFAVERCRTLEPPLREFARGRQVACHRADEWRDGLSPAGG